jgi:c-di-GMP-binding flagellar brake protein YcgR
MHIQSTTNSDRYNANAAGSRLFWSRNQIIEILDRFVRKDQPISVHYSNEERAIISRALQLNSDLDRVYFEYGDHKGANSRLLRSQEVQFSVENNSGKLQFTGPRVRDVLLSGKPAFHVPIPDRLVQTDRRQHQRIKIPQVSAPLVRFSLPDGRKVEGQLADMSTAGIGVIGLKADPKLPPGTLIYNCLIQLGDGKRVLVDLETRNAGVTPGAGGKLMHRIGFSLASRPREFSDLLQAFTVDF